MDILSKKERVKIKLYRGLWCSGAGTLILPVLSLIQFVFGCIFLPTYNQLDILSLVAIELLLLYFFKIILNNYQQIKTEIIQLEIRKIASDFIPVYVDFIKDKKSSHALKKYSTLIFSPLVSNEKNIPKVMDEWPSILRRKE